VKWGRGGYDGDIPEEVTMTQLHPQFVVDAGGEKCSVLLPIDEYEELLECLEDVLDLKEIERQRDEPRCSLESLIADMAKDRK
jgi:hypothetical protein